MYRIALYSVLWLLLIMISACNIKTDLYQHYWTMDVNSYMNYRKHVVSRDPFTTLPSKMIDKVRDFRYGDLLFSGDSRDTLLSANGWGKSISFLFDDEARTGKAGVEIVETNLAASLRNAEIVKRLTALLGTNVDRYTDGKDSVYIWTGKPANGQTVVLSQNHGGSLSSGYITTRLFMIKQSVVVPATNTTALDKMINTLKGNKYAVNGAQ
ncbi:hypothetical protein HHL17_14930 [Chitinophaga sp. G-6-1-13]|uniref:Uncharacterized protein n=1 Tax=Chitinophaga fulva TaxID=2728842 RepID=A0A848GLK2_9BACT|nr:hypothetical protein [Chitinophaga fulva]NML38501.1 hypothetical protein [Chitinophaga fulva]